MNVRFLLFFLAATLPLAAQPALDTPFQSGMVLQRDAQATSAAEQRLTAP